MKKVLFNSCINTTAPSSLLDSQTIEPIHRGPPLFFLGEMQNFLQADSKLDAEGFLRNDFQRKKKLGNF
jgi:hypothetical protein